MNTAIDVAIIGAGFAGLAAAIRLKEQGNSSFLVFERADQVGGTWRDNTYPGCACDIPSSLYSFSFAPNPSWSRTFSTQPEILAYLKNVVDRYDLNPQIRYNTSIIRTEFSPATGQWTLTDQRGHSILARVVILAVGPLNRPAIPKLAGMNTFSGKSFHSSNWDSSYDLTDKRVAVIGTGASAIQFIPEIAPRVRQLTVFQRTAPYVVPRQDRPISPGKQHLFRQLPIVQQAYRSLIYWTNELQGLSFLGNDLFNRFGTKRALKHLKNSIRDTELRRKLTPTFKLGCKRVLISDDYYPALTRSNVDLVTDGISEISGDTIADKNGRQYPADVIIYGTGFVVGGAVGSMNITGRQGQNLFDEWLVKGAEAYYGTTISGYPNLLFMVGPNTGLGHNSIVHIIESQTNYVLNYLNLLNTAGEGAYLDVKPDVQQRYNALIQQKMGRTVWSSGCQSYYLDSGGKNTTIWPALSAAYRRGTRQINPTDYQITYTKQTSPPVAH